MSTRRTRSLLGAVAAIGVTSGLLITTALAAGPRPRDSAVQYSATFVCGYLPPTPPQDDQFVKPGDYATSIEIHNVTGAKVGGAKKVALEYRSGAPAPPLVPNFRLTVVRDRVLVVDCVDIWAMVGVPPGTFLSGGLHIGLSQPLPVTAVYTSQTHIDPNVGPDPGAGHSIDVELIPPLVLPAG